MALLLIVLLAVGVGIWMGRASAPEEKSSPPEFDSDPAPGAREVINGVQVGYERTEAGAVEAATNFARAMASVSRDVEAYRRAIRTLAAPDWRDDAEKLAANSVDFLTERYGLNGSFTFSPVRYRVSSFSNGGATVEVWGVTVASGPKVSGIEESWLTASLELIWVEGDWRVAGESSEAGPTPELLQTRDQRLADELEGFKEYQYAPSP